jgi:Coenzyme PQQ synthesis protein D (PqqD)
MEHANPIRADSLEVNEAEDGLVVFDAVHDVVHHLNPSASWIFDLCDGTRDAVTIAGLLGEAFRLDPAPVQATVDGLEELAERRLIRWQAHPDLAS